MDTIEISQLPSPKIQILAKIDGLPNALSVYTKPSLALSVTPTEDVVMVFHSLVSSEVAASGKAFIQKVPLKAGYNELVIGQLGKKNDNTTTSRFFYLPQDRVASAASILDESNKDATSEADAVKQKLEKQVLELRYNAKKALFGTVTAITPSQVTLTVDGARKTVKLEPEVTRFHDVDSDGVVEDIEVTDIKAGDVVTVFISVLANEEKSYTVYYEPQQRLVVGKIAEVLASDYSLSVVGLNKSTTSYDVESSTLQQIFDTKTKKIGKSGFSQLTVGTHLYAVVDGIEKGTSLSRYLAIPHVL